MKPTCCLLATAAMLVALLADPARAHDPNQDFDQLPNAAAAHPAPTTCEELAALGYSSYAEDDDAKALRKRCDEEKKAKARAPAAPAKKT